MSRFSIVLHGILLGIPKPTVQLLDPGIQVDGMPIYLSWAQKRGCLSYFAFQLTSQLVAQVQEGWQPAPQEGQLSACISASISASFSHRCSKSSLSQPCSQMTSDILFPEANLSAVNVNRPRHSVVLLCESFDNCLIEFA